MTTVSVSTIRTNAKRRADMENNNFVSDAEWIVYIDKAYKKLYDILVSKYEDYVTAESPTQFTVASGASSAALPSDFYKCRGVDISTNGEWAPLGIYTFQDRNRETTGATYRSVYRSVRYRLIKNRILFTPEDRAPGTYRIWYIPTATSLTLAADTIDVPNGWEEYIEIDAAIQALDKEESDSSKLDAKLAKIEMKINEMALNRDAGMTYRITDVNGQSYYDEDLF